MLLGDGEAEDAELRQLLKQRKRDELVALVPALREGDDLLLGEAAELVADEVEAVVGQAERAEVALGDQLGEAGLLLGRRTLGDEAADRLAQKAAERGLRQIQVVRTDELDLAHRDAARDPGQVLAKADLENQALALAQPARLAQPLRPALELRQRLDVGLEPGEAVGGVLLAL